MYLKENKLHVTTLGRGYTWLDTGTHDSLVEASNYVKMVETHQGIKIACLEETAYLNGWITKEQLIEAAQPMIKNAYGKHLMNVAEGKIRYLGE